MSWRFGCNTRLAGTLDAEMVAAVLDAPTYLDAASCGQRNGARMLFTTLAGPLTMLVRVVEVALPGLALAALFGLLVLRVRWQAAFSRRRGCPDPRLACQSPL